MQKAGADAGFKKRNFTIIFSSSKTQQIARPIYIGEISPGVLTDERRWIALKIDTGFSNKLRQ